MSVSTTFAFSLLILLFTYIINSVNGHGRLDEPPARNSAWRYGFKVPADYDDVGLNCGGLGVQKTNNGKCGTCGDSYTGTRYHEVGGKYATGTIANVLKSMSSNSICEESYVKFYQMFSCYHQIAPTTNFMFGRIPTGLFEKKQIEKAKLHVPREKREDFESQRTKIDEVSSKLIRAGKVSTLSSHGEQTSKEVVKINKYLLQAFKGNHNEPVEFFPFVLHPTNFARTVENMFHITFLIKEGLAQLFHDNNDLPLICKSGRNDFFYNLPVDRRKKKADETINIEHNETTTTTSLSKKCQQLVISIDMEEWEALVEAFGIETPVMPDK
ncbi:unnamed protein product [Didymodactylos carnosus]|uniref:Non-structural maintenance of chromosomes element 4 n=1 Tax=Didymodactylos carnosus TaxID=1234261 RepID=A0A8S2D136_9BILA|nr:unnamed protein product [Didymodactylos carnosus]CAF3640034.1 unnamed protein product [Didymodactylos carnosus]